MKETIIRKIFISKLSLHLDKIFINYQVFSYILEALDSKEETERNFLLMGIAYAANIGGTGVITGNISGSVFFTVHMV